MKILFKTSAYCLLLAATMLSACKKSTTESATQNQVAAGDILAHFAMNIAEPNLTDLSVKAAELNASITTFNSIPSQSALQNIQQSWYATRVLWEQSEAFLFGPVATKDLDPAIDSWPVNFVDIDSVINNAGNVFTPSFIDSLDPTLKGFHPLEYLVFGANGQRNYTELSSRQKEYLVALGAQLQRVTAQMAGEWKPGGGNFEAQVINAGKTGSQYATQKDALLEIANAMNGIIEEVGSEKINEPFINKNPSLEESPFAKNSWADFKNNIIGARNVYTGKYMIQGKSLKDLVQQYNKSLDLQIQQKFDAVIANLGAYTSSFGDCISSQPAAVKATQDQLADLHELLDTQLILLIQTNVK